VAIELEGYMFFRRFWDSVSSPDIHTRWNTAKYVSDYVGMVTRLVFINFAIKVAQGAEFRFGSENDLWYSELVKYSCVGFLFVVSLVLLIAFFGATQSIIWSILDEIFPPSSQSRLRWLAALVSGAISVILFVGLQMGIPVIITQLAKGQTG
jgi:hypothetical protein